MYYIRHRTETGFKKKINHMKIQIMPKFVFQTHIFMWFKFSFDPALGELFLYCHTGKGILRHKCNYFIDEGGGWVIIT